LNEMESAGKYRLPSESEWEYACRAGTTTRYSFGDDESELGEYAWYYENSGSETHPVGQKNPNPWGLYDMHGNVWEWCSDWYNDSYYATSPDTDPAGPSSEEKFRVLRGGSWLSDADFSRSSTRGNNLPSISTADIGFRVVLEK
jgi:formylglycine-generating enzyme required for sulfatase activity